MEQQEENITGKFVNKTNPEVSFWKSKRVYFLLIPFALFVIFILLFFAFFRDSVLVTVGDFDITEKHYEEGISKWEQALLYSNEENGDYVDELVMDLLIEEKIIRTEAQRRGFSVNSDDVENEYRKLWEEYENEDFYLEMLAVAYDWNAGYVKETIELDLLKEMISDEVLKDYDLRALFLRYDYSNEGFDVEGVEIAIKELHEMMHQGKSFDYTVAFAEEHHFKGIDGFIEYKRINEQSVKHLMPIEDGEVEWQAISQLSKVGDISDVVKSPAGFWIFFVAMRVGEGEFVTWEDFIEDYKKRELRYSYEYMFHNYLQEVYSFFSIQPVHALLTRPTVRNPNPQPWHQCNKDYRCTEDGYETAGHRGQAFGIVRDRNTGLPISGVSVETQLCFRHGCNITQCLCPYSIDRASTVTSSEGSWELGHLYDPTLTLTCWSRWHFTFSKQGYQTEDISDERARLRPNNNSIEIPVTLRPLVTPVNGSCGSAHNTTTSTRPTTNLCSLGISTSVSETSTQFTWACLGSGGGANASCFANKPVIQAECGSAHGQTRTTPPTHGLCAFGGGTPSTVTTGTNRYTWTCSLPGSQVSCFAHREQVPVNGACGSAHGSTVLAPPTSGLCTRGNPTSITTTTRNYTWRCLGTDGGSNASCSANRLLEEAKRVPYPSGGRLYSFVAAVNPSVGSPRRLDPYAGSSRIIPWNSPSMPSSCERQTTLTLERSTHSRNYGQQARLKYRYKLDDHPWSPFIYAPSPYTPGVSHVNVILREGQDYDIEAHSYSDNRCDGETYGGSIAGRFQVNHKPRVISIEPIAPPQANNWPWGVNPNNGVSGNQNLDARNFVINSDDAIPFAKGPGLEEECRTPSGRLYGDANGDGSITTADVQLVIQASLGIVTLDSVSREAADVNGDGDISILDVVLIERYVNGLIDAFPVCPSLPPAPVDGDLDGGCVIDNPKYFRVVFEDLDGCDDIDPRNTDIPDDVYEGFATTRQLGLRAVDRNSPSYVVNGSLQSQEIQCLPGGNRLSAVFRIEFTGNQNRNFNLQASARDVLGNRSYYSSPHSAYAHSHGNPAYWLQPTAADVWSYDGRGPRLEIRIKILGPQELRVEWSAIDNLNSLSGLRFLRTYASLVRGTVLDQDDDYSGIYYNTESADPTYLPVSEDFGYYYEIIADRLALNPSDAEAQRTITRTAQRDVDIGINQDGDLVFSMVGVDRACNYIYEEEGLELGAPWIATRGGFVYSRGGINLPSRDNIRYSSLMGGALGLGDESATLSTEWVAPFGNITYGYSSNPYNNEIGVPIYEVLREIAERRFPDGAGRWSDETIDLSRCVDEPFVYFIEGDLNINPDDYRNLAQADGAGCIFVVDGNMTIGPGEYRSTFNSLNDFQVGYDVMRGLFIVEGEINIEFGDADKEVRDGLKVVGGLMAFETENTDTAIRLRRSLQLRDNLTHPTLMLFHDPRYIEIAREIFGDTLGGGHIRDVGFLE